MNHIVLGTDDQRPLGMILGFAGIAVVIVFMDSGSLHFVEAFHAAAAYAKGCFATSASRYPQSSLPPAVYKRADFTVLVAEWQDARTRGLETNVGARLPRLQAQGWRARGETGGTVFVGNEGFGRS